MEQYMTNTEKNKDADDFRADAAIAIERSAESWERSDTDGCLTQWACGWTERLSKAKAQIREEGDTAEFIGLWEGDRRVRAKQIETKFGSCWLLHDDEQDLIAKRGKKFLPIGEKSRVLKSLGLTQRLERAPAWAALDGSGHGLSGNVWISTFRTGDKWGGDAVLAD